MRRTVKGNLYELDEEFVEMLHKWKGYILVFSGPSGVGKTTLSEAMNLPTIRSITTRERRKVYETYDFVTNSAFRKLHNERKLATIVQFKNDFYGFDKEQFKELAKNNRVIVLTLSPVMYRLLKLRYSRTIGVYVHAKRSVVKKRLLKRDGFLDDVRLNSYDNNNRSKEFYHIKIDNSRNNRFLFHKTAYVKALLKIIMLLDKKKRTFKLRKKLFYTANVNFPKPKHHRKNKNQVKPEQVLAVAHSPAVSED